MANMVFRDWIVEMGFDASKVDKGLAKLDKRMGKTLGNKETTQRNYNRLAKTETNNLRAQNQLEQRRLTLRKKAYQAEQLGLKGDFKSGVSALGAKNKDKLTQRALDLEKKITEEKRRQRKEAERIRDQAILTRELNRKAPFSRYNARAELTREQRASNVRPEFTSYNARATQARAANLEANRYGVTKDIDNFNRSMSQNLRGDAHALEFKKVSDSVTELQRRLRNASDAPSIRNIKRDLRTLKLETQEYTRAVAANNKTMTASKFAHKGFSDSLRNLGRTYLSVFAVIGAGAALLRTSSELDKIQATFLAASGSAQQAAIDFNYVRDAAKRLGADLSTSAASYSQLAIAGKQAGLSLQDIRDLFESSAMAATAYGLSAADSEGVTRA